MSGKLTLISSATASGSSSVEFTSGIDSTYDEYVFYFVDINPADDARYFTFQTSTNGGSSYGMTATTTSFEASHGESGGSAGLAYKSGSDQAQSTSHILLTELIGNGSDECAAGELHLFSPSSTSKVKHFYSHFNCYHYTDLMLDDYVAGYINDTNDIDAVQFKVSTGNFDGQIYCFGVS